MRAFIALPIPPDAGPPGTERHLTLRFFPALDAAGASAAVRAIDRLSRSHPIFAFHLEGVNGFPDLENPRVLYREIGEGRDRIVTLHDELDALLVEEGFAPEARRFTPHVTIARVRQGSKSPHPQWPPFATVSVAAEEIILFESHLTPEGAVHRPRHRARLADAPNGGPR
jgi:2'-5' RNA ligase